MKYVFSAVLALGALMTAACVNPEASGRVMPLPQQSESMRVVGAGLGSGATNGRNMEQVTYFAVVRLSDPQADKNKYVVFEFQNPEDLNDFEKTAVKVSEADKDGCVRVQSQPVFGLESYTGYLIRISLAADPEGKQVDETLNQYVRSYFPPAGFTNQRP